MALSCATSAPPRLASDAWLASYVGSGRFTNGEPKAITPLRDGRTVLFLRTPKDTTEASLWSFDAATNTERVILTPEQVAAAPLSATETARQERLRLNSSGITQFVVSPDEQTLLVPAAGKLLLFNRASGAISHVSTGDAGAYDAKFSPDGSRLAFVRDGRVFTMSIDGVAAAITSSPPTGVTYGQAELVAQEEMGRFDGYWWSPDGKALLIERADESKVGTITLLDPMHPDAEPVAQRYPRAGKDNAVVTLEIRGSDGAAPVVTVDWDTGSWPYLVSASWTAPRGIILVVQSRRQERVAVLAADAVTGKTHPLFEEQDAAYVNVDPTYPVVLPDGAGFVWLSERTGWPRLELRGPDGAPARWLTPEGMTVTRTVGLSADGHSVRFEALVDRVHQHVFIAPLDGSGPKPIETAPGWHTAVYTGDVGVISSDPAKGPRTSYVVGRLPPVDGGALPSAIIPSVATPADVEPRTEYERVQGQTCEVDAEVIWPRNAEAGRKYPVLVYVYGGPTHRVVASPWRRSLLFQWFADHGAIVVAIDGRGTPGRGRDFERSTVGEFTTAPLEDQVAGLQALADRHPEMDLDRVGIFGWSFGGTMTMMAVLRHPEVFKAGAAVATVTDWTLYDTHYTERYLGLPADNPEGYRTSSPLTYADKLTRPLSILHGTLDDNVHAANSFAMVDALFRAGKKHIFVPIAGAAHQVRDHAGEIAVWTHIATFMDSQLHFEHEPPITPAK